MINEGGSFEHDSKEIANSLCISIIDSSHSSPSDGEEEEYSHALRLVPYELDGVSTFALGIESLTTGQKPNRRRRQGKKKVKPHPFYIDFCPPTNSRIGKRGARDSGTDLLIKAVAPKGSCDYTVCDLTAGFGQDSLILALNGASKVYMVERDPIVFALLDDALRRVRLLSSHSDLAQKLANKLQLRAGDGADALKLGLVQEQETENKPDICYLDPMFPPRTKSAAVWLAEGSSSRSVYAPIKVSPP